MNVAISTFVRRGYLLTALAVAVLLAGFSVTAWAQTIPTVPVTLTMRASPTALEEGASVEPSTPGRVTVTITWSGTYDDDLTKSGARKDVFVSESGSHLKLTATCNEEEFTNAPLSSECLFDVVVKKGATATSFTGLGTNMGAHLTFAADDDDDTLDKVVKTIELYISHSGDDGDWNTETIGLTLELQDKSVDVVTGEEEDETPITQSRKLRATPRKLTLTINDDERKPTFNFDPTNIQLAKDNEQMVTVGVGVGAGGEGTLPDEGTENIRDTLMKLIGGRPGGSSDLILLSVSPADAVGPEDDPDRGLVSITDSEGMDLEPDGQGNYEIGTIAAAVSGIALMIKAKEPSGFRDEMISLMLMDGRTEEQMTADGGGIMPADPARVTILSGAETPTVEFSTDSISIDEGDSETVHLLAGGMQGDEVGSVTVAVRGDADISLEQNGSPTSGLVSFGGNANAELTIISNSDPSLEDGEEKTATVTLTDASGAIVGDPGTLTVTVVGSTAVPVLPLFGAVAPGLAPDGRRRAAVSAAPGLARRARRRGTVVGKGGPARMRRVPFFAFSRVFRVMIFPANSRLLPGGLSANGS